MYNTSEAIANERKNNEKIENRGDPVELAEVTNEGSKRVIDFFHNRPTPPTIKELFFNSLKFCLNNSYFSFP